MHHRISMSNSGIVHLSNVPAETGVLGPEVNGICGCRLMSNVRTLGTDEGLSGYSMCRRCTEMATDQHRTHPYCVSIDGGDGEMYLHFDLKGAADFYASLVEDTNPHAVYSPTVKRFVAVVNMPGEWREVDEFRL